MAGFPKEKGSFFLKRDAVQPPSSLTSQIFPEIEEWEKKMDAKLIQEDMAAIGFWRLIKYLRVVILQDSLLLKDQFPNLRIWEHRIFHCDEYLSFEKAGKIAIEKVNGHFFFFLLLHFYYIFL